LVVVHESSAEEENPLLTRINNIKLSRPILWDPDNFPWTKRRLSKTVDVDSTLNIIKIYEDKLDSNSQILVTKQNEIMQRIKEVDNSVALMYKAYSVRQKQYAKHAEKMYRVSDLIRTLSKCQVAFNESISTIDMLNNMLPEEERLEKFRC